MAKPSPSSIVSPGANKGAVNPATQYTSAIAEHNAALLAQKNQATLVTLKAANDSLSRQINSPQGRESSLVSQISDLTDIIPYAKSLVISTQWGNNTNYNAVISRNAVVSFNNSPGTAITTGDITKIIAYITSSQNNLNSLKAKKTTLENAIDANKKKIDAILGSVVLQAKPTKPTPPKTADIAAQTTAVVAPPPTPTSDYQWNLPPHKWSLPVEPSDVSDTVAARTDAVHTTRRGKIWYYQGYVGTTAVPTLDEVGTTGTHTQAANAALSINKYGFQFMWNPETFSQNTAVNMSVTPSGSDPTIALTGFAAANSTMSFTLRLDRTNDFACANNLFLANKDLSDVAGFYTIGNSDKSNFKSSASKLSDLLAYGTEADLEYLYKTVNGTGFKNVAGRSTSNIGYLMPALIRIDLGQQKFVGVVSSVGVNHLAFTRDMVPIRTDVDITIDLRANIQPTTNNGSSSKPTTGKK
jgi:hypothetical protein